MGLCVHACIRILITGLHVAPLQGTSSTSSSCDLPLMYSRVCVLGKQSLKVIIVTNTVHQGYHVCRSMVIPQTTHPADIIIMLLFKEIWYTSSVIDSSSFFAIADHTDNYTMYFL